MRTPAAAAGWKTKRRTRDALGLMLIVWWLLSSSAPPAAAAGRRAQGPPPAIPRRQSAAATPAPEGALARPRYYINLKLDFDRRAYAGTERVVWTNRDDRPTSVIYFHLYANLRANNNNNSGSGGRASHASEDSPGALFDEPRLEVTEVRAALTKQPLVFSVEDQGTTLRVQLREAVGAGAAAEIEIVFNGQVPEIDADETSLSAHVVQQVGAALQEARETRRARDTNFFARGVMLLGDAYPVLAVRSGDDWQRKVEASIGDFVHAEVADYEVVIEAPPDVALFTSGDAAAARPGGAHSGGAGGTAARGFSGEGLRNFAVIAGRALRSAEQNVSGVKVRAIYTAEHESVGRRVLAVAAAATRVYSARFGELPLRILSVTEAPLVAGLGSAEFTGMGVIASAFYVDFEGPTMRNLPEIVREQRASVEDSLEFAVAQVVAHQWWGATVGSDPGQTPVLNEALAHFSALVYYREVHGPERAAVALEDQLRGVYQVYRTFGGEDMTADRAARDYRNSFQYAAIVASKGALMFVALQKLMGEERFWTALRRYYEANLFEIAEMNDLRAAFIAEVSVAERRDVTRTFRRWLSEKRGDQDIAPPNPQLAAAIGLATEPNITKDRNAFSRLGRFFWRQMTRIR